MTVEATGVCAGAGVEDGTAVALTDEAGGADGTGETDGDIAKATTTRPLAATEQPAIM